MGHVESPYREIIYTRSPSLSFKPRYLESLIYSISSSSNIDRKNSPYDYLVHIGKRDGLYSTHCASAPRFLHLQVPDIANSSLLYSIFHRPRPGSISHSQCTSYVGHFIVVDQLDQAPEARGQDDPRCFPQAWTCRAAGT